MSIDALRELLPAYAKDLSLNLSTLAGETTLNDQQKWGTFVAAAYAVGQGEAVREINAAAEAFGASIETLTAAWPRAWAAATKVPHFCWSLRVVSLARLERFRLRSLA